MKKILITFIQLYRFIIAPVLPPVCRFIPTCSEYAIEAIETYGSTKGLYLSVRRLLRCHPFHPGGYDPVKR
jgi:putative membrane protein insertion efficiency factor